MGVWKELPSCNLLGKYIEWCPGAFTHPKFHAQNAGGDPTGPDAAGLYTIARGYYVQESAASDSEVQAVLESWDGKTFPATFTNADWTVQSVTC
jgi:hypothetical protein